jgi:hypothetical protein
MHKVPSILQAFDLAKKRVRFGGPQEPAGRALLDLH